ncbi:MAG: nuclear transport factor 2 family protein [Acidobacteria bacterium]|nr:nuclear transport factor 2 family protein [Acidobacteriota bacterium]
MRKAILLGMLAAVAAASLACGGNGGGNSTNVANTSNGNATGDNGNTLAVKTATPAAVTNNAPTLTPVIKAYCEAMNKKDEAALRKIYSSDTIASFEKQMKEQKVPTLMKFLEDDKVGSTCELTNEQINGDTATARFTSDTYKTGLSVMFVKENGEWKLTNKSPDITGMKPSGNSNAAK